MKRLGVDVVEPRRRSASTTRPEGARPQGADHSAGPSRAPWTGSWSSRGRQSPPRSIKSSADNGRDQHLIEHSGAQVGLITTEGYRDILHIARHKKPYNFSIYQDLPWQRYPIVRRRYRLTVPERITKDGAVLVPLDEEKARAQVRALKEAGVEAVAVCFLFSFSTPPRARVARSCARSSRRRSSVSSEVLPSTASTSASRPWA
jgi:hypothetical protein